MLPFPSNSERDSLVVYAVSVFHMCWAEQTRAVEYLSPACSSSCLYSVVPPGCIAATVDVSPTHSPPLYSHHHSSPPLISIHHYSHHSLASTTTSTPSASIATRRIPSGLVSPLYPLPSALCSPSLASNPIWPSFSSPARLCSPFFCPICPCLPCLVYSLPSLRDCCSSPTWPVRVRLSLRPNQRLPSPTTSEKKFPLLQHQQSPPLLHVANHRFCLLV